MFYSLPTLAHKTTPHTTKTITACCRAISICESEAAHCSEALHMSVAGSASEESSLVHLLLTDYAVNWICRYVRGVKATAEVSDKIFWRMLIGSVVHFTRRFWQGLEAMICDGLVEKNVGTASPHLWKLAESSRTCPSVLGLLRFVFNTTPKDLRQARNWLYETG